MQIGLKIENMVELSMKQQDILIPLLNATKSFEVFDKAKTFMRVVELPFFKHSDLLITQTFSTIPPVKYHFLWNREKDEIIAMDGTRNCIFDNLQKLGFILNSATIVPYLKFVLDNVWTDKGNLRLVESTYEIAFSEQPSSNDWQFLDSTIRPAKMEKSGENYKINCIIIYGTEVFESEIELKLDGSFVFLTEKELASGMRCLRVIFLE